MGRQAYADIGDEGWPAGRAFLDDVEDVGAVQHDEVGRLADPVDQPGQGMRASRASGSWRANPWPTSQAAMPMPQVRSSG